MTDEENVKKFVVIGGNRKISRFWHVGKCTHRDSESMSSHRHSDTEQNLSDLTWILAESMGNGGNIKKFVAERGTKKTSRFLRFGK